MDMADHEPSLEAKRSRIDLNSNVLKFKQIGRIQMRSNSNVVEFKCGRIQTVVKQRSQII